MEELCHIQKYRWIGPLTVSGLPNRATFPRLRGDPPPRKSDLVVSVEACHHSPGQSRAEGDCPRSAGIRAF
jgi:hypothetical protein